MLSLKNVKDDDVKRACRLIARRPNAVAATLQILATKSLKKTPDVFLALLHTHTHTHPRGIFNPTRFSNRTMRLYTFTHCA